MEYIEVARIINSHGIKGSVKVFLLTSNKDRFKKDITFYIDKEIKVTINNYKKISDNIAILTFNEYNNINEILKFKNLGVYVEEKDVIKLPKDEYYIHDLVGLRVYNQHSEYIGNIKNVLYTLSNDVYEVFNEVSNETYYIPAVKKFVANIDVENNIVNVITIKGMLND